MDVAFPAGNDRARVRAQTHAPAEQIPMDFVDIGHVKRFNLSVMHFHRKVRPESLHWITRKEDDFQVWEVSNDLASKFAAQRRIVWRNITGDQRSLGFEQSAVILEIYIRFRAEAVQTLKKMTIALISTAPRGRVFNPAQLIKIMQFLYRRHPEIRMGIELLIKPCRPAFVGSDTDEIGLCTLQRTVLVAFVSGACAKSPSPMHPSSILSPAPKKQECRCDSHRQNCFAWPACVGLS